MGTPTKLNWNDAESATDVFPDVTPQLVAAVMKALAGTPLALTSDQRWEHTEQNELRDVVDNNAQCLIEHIADTDIHGGGTGGTGVESEPWALGNSARRASVYDNGVLVEYVALETATETQIAQIQPGTNPLVWLPANFRIEQIGDGALDVFTFNHGFADGGINIQVFKLSTGDEIYPHIANSAGIATVNFAKPIPINSHIIVVSR